MGAALEDVWNGYRIHSAVNSNAASQLNPAEAFRLWFLDSVEAENKRGTGQYLAISKRFFIQNETFPCDDCCLCRVFH